MLDKPMKYILKLNYTIRKEENKNPFEVHEIFVEDKNFVSRCLDLFCIS